MAETAHPVNSPEARQVWSRMLAKEALDGCMMSKFMGEDEGSLIQLKKVFQKGDGVKCSFDLVGLLTGAGTAGDETLEGNEERLNYFRDNVTIQQLRHAVRTRGKMSEQMVPWDTRRVAKDRLRMWTKERWDIWAFNQLCGFTSQTDERYTGLSCVKAPTRHCFASGESDEAVATATAAEFQLDMITDMKTALELSEVNVSPVVYDGGEAFVLFLHPYQSAGLKKSEEWKTIQSEAGSRGKNNPLFTGALGYWDGVVIHESKYVTRGVGDDGAPLDGVRRAVMCGAQSLVGAIQSQSVGGASRMMDWNEKSFDYGNKLGVSTGIFGGLKKAQWKSTGNHCANICGEDGLGDHGTVVMSTAARPTCIGAERLYTELTPAEAQAQLEAENLAAQI